MTRINRSPGKFESEPLSTQYAYDASLDGCADVYSDGNGGESYSCVSGPFERDDVSAFRGSLNYDEDSALTEDEVSEIVGAVGVIVHESNSGFVSCTWFDSQSEYDTACEALAEEFSDSDSDDSDSDDDTLHCDSCEMLSIQGVACHESGCPDAWKSAERDCRLCGDNFQPTHRHQTACDDCNSLDDDIADVLADDEWTTPETIAPYFDHDNAGHTDDLLTVDVPAEYVQLATDWNSGQRSMLYALSSTGALTLGSIRPDPEMTDRQWHLSLWDALIRELDSSIAYARRASGDNLETLAILRENTESLRLLTMFRAFSDETVKILRQLYKLTD